MDYQRVKTIDVDASVSAASYVAGRALGDKLTFADAANAGGGGVIHSLTLIDRAAQGVEIDLILFDSDFTATTDNSAFDPTDSDLIKCIGVVTIRASDYALFNDNAVATVAGIGLAFRCAPTGTALYGQLIVRGSATYAAVTDVLVRLAVLQ